MFIFYFCLKQQDKHCIRHYDCDYDCDYDKKIRYKYGPLFISLIIFSDLHAILSKDSTRKYIIPLFCDSISLFTDNKTYGSHNNQQTNLQTQQEEEVTRKTYFFCHWKTKASKLYTYQGSRILGQRHFEHLIKGDGLLLWMEPNKKIMPERTYNPITAMGVLAIFTFQLENTKR